MSKALDLDAVEGQVVSGHCQRAGGHGAPPDLSLRSLPPLAPPRSRGKWNQPSGAQSLFHFLFSAEIKVSVEQVSETAGFGVGALEYGYEPLSNPGQLGAA